MCWAYKVVQYPLQKEGILGDSSFDGAAIEASLNEYGQAGWELVNILKTVDCLSAVFKQSTKERRDPLSLENAEAVLSKKDIKEKTPSVFFVEHDSQIEKTEEIVVDTYKSFQDEKVIVQSENHEINLSGDIGSIPIK